MMKVIYSEMDTPAGIGCRLEAAGHAGYAPAGQDIVCAGASTVMQGLVYLLAGEETARSEAFDEPEGPRLAVSVEAPCEEWVKGAFELAKSCFVLLAERYPENIRFADVSRRGEQSMMDLQLFAAEATAACGGNREPRRRCRPCSPGPERSADPAGGGIRNHAARRSTGCARSACGCPAGRRDSGTGTGETGTATGGAAAAHIGPERGAGAAHPVGG